MNHAEETVEGNGSVWFGDPMRNARKRRSAKCAKQNGDPGAIRTRDPQLRRLVTKSAQVPVMKMNSRNAVPIN